MKKKENNSLVMNNPLLKTIRWCKNEVQVCGVIKDEMLIKKKLRKKLVTKQIPKNSMRLILSLAITTLYAHFEVGKKCGKPIIIN